MSTRVRWSVIALLVSLFVVALNAPWAEVRAQSGARMFEAPRLGLRARPTERPIRPHQARKARLRLEVLESPSFVLNLFDNAERVVTRTKVERPDADRADQYVWHGKTDDDGIVTFAVVNGVATGTVFLDGRSFEITMDPDGDYTIAELNPAAFPVDEDPLEAPDVASDVMAPNYATSATAPTTAADGYTLIDVMVVWTPAARTAAGGTSAIQSLVLSSVANANLAYANSLVNARLRLVHSAEVAYTETPTNISGDLSALFLASDGKMDSVHSLRTQYGADIVTLLGNGYAAKGACGLGYLMSTPSTSFRTYAFNVVDRTCATGNLSYAHEVGHNQGLQHDPGSSSGAPSRPYAYGYQDPGNAFKTVLSYGSAPRVPYFSNPAKTYNGRATGTSSQNNARALNDNASIVSAFKSASGSTSCSYTVSPGSFSFSKAAATASVTVTTTSACSWNSSSGSAWATVSGSKTGSGTAVVSVTTNSGGSRTATVVVAGKSVTVSQASGCAYTVSPLSLSFSKAASTASVAVTTTSACGWSSSSPSTWAKVTGARTGSGTAVVSVTANSAGARKATLVVAGKSVVVSQASGCVYTVSPTSLSFTKAGGSKTVTVSTTSVCGWSQSSPVSWATVSGGKVGSGLATVKVAANTSASRSVTVIVAAKKVVVTQQ